VVIIRIPKKGTSTLDSSVVFHRDWIDVKNMNCWVQNKFVRYLSPACNLLCCYFVSILTMQFLINSLCISLNLCYHWVWIVTSNVQYTPSVPFLVSFWHWLRVSRFKNIFMYPDTARVMIQRIFSVHHWMRKRLTKGDRGSILYLSGHIFQYSCHHRQLLLLFATTTYYYFLLLLLTTTTTYYYFYLLLLLTTTSYYYLLLLLITTSTCYYYLLLVIATSTYYLYLLLLTTSTCYYYLVLLYYLLLLLTALMIVYCYLSCSATNNRKAQLCVASMFVSTWDSVHNIVEAGGSSRKHKIGGKRRRSTKILGKQSPTSISLSLRPRMKDVRRSST
jgi:hypothetical protein